MTVQCDCVIEARKPDIVVEKESNKAIIIIVDIASLWNHRVYEKDGENVPRFEEGDWNYGYQIAGSDTGSCWYTRSH